MSTRIDKASTALRRAARVVAVFALALGLVARAGFAQTHDLHLKVVTSSPGSLNVNFTLISGDTDAVLVDVPFLRSDAYRLVADILDSGKKLKTIVVTHGHPDHYFSLDVFRDAFPDVKVVAAPEVVTDIWRGFPNRLAFWGPRIGANAPRYPFVPEALDGTAFALEGHTIELLGPMQGDAAHSTAVYVPDLNALMAGDIVFNHVHVGTGGQSRAQRAAWQESLKSLLELNPEIVVAGHTKRGLPHTRAALEYTLEYLQRFERAVDEASDAQELMAVMRREYPDAMDFQGDFILTSAANSAMQEKLGRQGNQ